MKVAISKHVQQPVDDSSPVSGLWLLKPTGITGTVIQFCPVFDTEGCPSEGAYVQIGNKIEAFSLDQLEVIENES